MKVSDAAVVQLQRPSIIYPECNPRQRGTRNKSKMDVEKMRAIARTLVYLVRIMTSSATKLENIMLPRRILCPKILAGQWEPS